MQFKSWMYRLSLHVVRDPMIMESTFHSATGPIFSSVDILFGYRSNIWDGRYFILL